jgi:hypothetical protein
VIGVPDTPNAAYAFGLQTLADNYSLKDQVNQLNRELASRKADGEKLKERIEQMRKGGSIDLQHEIDVLEGILNSRFPEVRISNQRKEIRLLHGVIRRLNDEIKELKGDES